MEITEPLEESTETKIKEKVKEKTTKKIPAKKSASSTDAPERRKPEEPKKLKIKAVPVEEELEKMKESASSTDAPERRKAEEKWFEPEGQLAIDVYQTANELIIQSAIAGVKAENLDIIMEGDMMTIKGRRERPLGEEGDYFSQECFWGPFKREIILPAEIDPGRVQATMKEGVLIIRLPKILREKKQIIKIKQ